MCRGESDADKAVVVTRNDRVAGARLGVWGPVVVVFTIVVKRSRWCSTVESGRE